MAGIPDTLKGRSFTRVSDWNADELRTALDLADELKVERARRRELRILPGRTVGLIFRKPSTRTRISSEVGIAELGGMALYVPAADLQLSRGESTRDTALVLSRFLSAITIRTFDQAEVDEFAEHATIPIVNGLTDTSHPLQALADAMTIRERFGTLEGIRVAYLGDGNNVCHSLMRIAARTGMHLIAASPEATCRTRRSSTPAVRTRRRQEGASRSSSTLPRPSRARGCSTPTSGRAWARRTSRRDGSVISRRTIDGEKLTSAAADAVALHCLPAHVGEEITADVLYGDRSLVWDQAENRLHVYKAVLALTVR